MLLMNGRWKPNAKGRRLRRWLLSRVRSWYAGYLSSSWRCCRPYARRVISTTPWCRFSCGSATSTRRSTLSCTPSSVPSSALPSKNCCASKALTTSDWKWSTWNAAASLSLTIHVNDELNVKTETYDPRCQSLPNPSEWWHSVLTGLTLQLSPHYSGVKEKLLTSSVSDHCFDS